MHKGGFQLQEILRRRARELGKSLTGLSRETGIARSYLYKLASGHVLDPSVRTLVRLAAAIEVSPITLLRLYGNLNSTKYSKNPPSSEFRNLRDDADLAIINPDIAIPSHSVVLGGESFEKIWEIQNAGERYWKDRSIARIDVPYASREGRHTVISHPHLVSLSRRVMIPPTAPGGVIRLHNVFVAPDANCTVASIWRIEDKHLSPCYEPCFFLKVLVMVIKS